MTDVALQTLLRDVRSKVALLPKRLRPKPTCVTLSVAAAVLGISIARLRLALRGRHVLTLRVNGERLVPLSVLKSLRR